jgi:X-linked retinitis pigmentosa GTPase regulator
MEEGHDKDVWKHLYPRERNLYNIICYDSREEEKKGVQVFDVATFYMEENLLKIANKKAKRRSSKSKVKSIEPFVDFASPDRDGKVITFSIESAKSKDTYPQYGGHAFEDRDYDIEDEVLESVYTLDDLLIIPSYKELKAVFKRSEEEDSEDEDIETDTDEEKEDEENEEEDSADEEEDDSEDEEDEDEEEIDEDDSEDEDEDEKPKKKKNKKKKVNKCEFGLEFGVDTNDFDECEDECDPEVWEACLAKKEEESKKKKKKKKRR